VEVIILSQEVIDETALILSALQHDPGYAFLRDPAEDLYTEGETEATLVADWLGASLPSLREVWDNEEDAIYDQLFISPRRTR
jgi:hypothetical protein